MTETQLDETTALIGRLEVLAENLSHVEGDQALVKHAIKSLASSQRSLDIQESMTAQMLHVARERQDALDKANLQLEAIRRLCEGGHGDPLAVEILESLGAIPMSTPQPSPALPEDYSELIAKGRKEAAWWHSMGNLSLAASQPANEHEATAIIEELCAALESLTSRVEESEKGRDALRAALEIVADTTEGTNNFLNDLAVSALEKADLAALSAPQSEEGNGS